MEQGDKVIITFSISIDLWVPNHIIIIEKLLPILGKNIPGGFEYTK